MYKYIDDACINMNVYRENIYVYVLCFTSKVDKQTDRAFPSHSFLLSTFSSLQRCSVQNQSYFGFFLGIYASIWFEIFSCVAHLYKYLSSAFKDESCE